MERRSANYSDRPIFTLMEEMWVQYTESRIKLTSCHSGWAGYVCPRKCGTERGIASIVNGCKTHSSPNPCYSATSQFNAERCTFSYQVCRNLQNYSKRTFGGISKCVSFMAHVNFIYVDRFTAALLMEIIYGHRVQSGTEDEYVELAERAATKTVLAGSPGSGILSLLVDFFPVCMWSAFAADTDPHTHIHCTVKHYPLWLPGSGFKVKTNYIKGLVIRFLNVPYNMVKEQMVSPQQSLYQYFRLVVYVHLDVGHCATVICGHPPRKTSQRIWPYRGWWGRYKRLRRLVLHRYVLNKINMYHLRFVISWNGYRTWEFPLWCFVYIPLRQSGATLTAFILSMVMNPEAFKKAQEEIDQVVGNDRLPDFEDRKSLPYMECVLKELYR